MNTRIFTPLLLLCAFAGAGAHAEESDAEIAKKLNNPVASLISVPFQANWDFRMGPLDQGSQFKLNFQPVVPITLNQDWNLIIRTIVPYINQEDVLKGPNPNYSGIPGNVLPNFPRLRERLDDAAEEAFDRAVRRQPVNHHQEGLGDITQSFFFSPREPVGGWTFGFGPVLNYPTATDGLLGSEKCSVGPTLLALRQEYGWTCGVLANHLWSYAGDEDRRNVNATFVQPFVSFTTPTHTTFGVNSEATYDWNTSQWTVPVNGTISQLARIGKLPVQFAVGGRYYAEGPSGAPEWGLRFAITLVLPEAHSASATASDGKSLKK